MSADTTPPTDEEVFAKYEALRADPCRVFDAASFYLTHHTAIERLRPAAKSNEDVRNERLPGLSFVTNMMKGTLK